jgi:hypothetical protein
MAYIKLKILLNVYIHIKFISFYSSTVELDTVNIMIDVRFILGAKINGLEPGWLGASFGSRNSYVRIIIIRMLYI